MMAAEHAYDAPQNLESARTQIQALQSELAARDGRIKELELLLGSRLSTPDNVADWLLDWAINQHRLCLLDDLAESETRPSPLGGKPLAHDTRTALTAQVIARGCFRFLDLIPEVRNRIYHFAAREAFSVPCMVACDPHDRDHVDLAFREYTSVHLARRAGSRGAYNRLAMLRVSRQVHKECRQIFYTNMSLDATCLHHRASLTTMLEIVASPFRNKLQFVRHLELGAVAAEYFLFSSATSRGLKHLQDRWMTDFHISPLSFNCIRNIRTLLFNLEAVTISDGQDGMPDEYGLDVGFETAIMLSRQGGLCMERLFPRLIDIVTVTDYGSERMRKVGVRKWELYYSHEEIPEEIRDDVRELADEMFVDPETGLMRAGALANMAATPAWPVERTQALFDYQDYIRFLKAQL